MSKVSHKFFALNQTVGRGKKIFALTKTARKMEKKKKCFKMLIFSCADHEKNFFSSKQMFEAEGREKCEVIKKRRKKYSTALQHKS